MLFPPAESESSQQSTDIPPLPDELSNLLHQFQYIFQEPTGLPPHRDCDHHIPLKEGAKHKPILFLLRKCYKILKYGQAQAHTLLLSFWSGKKINPGDCVWISEVSMI
jgi:hypothetical protein